MNEITPDVPEPDVSQNGEYDVSELIALSKYLFKEVSTEFLKTYKLEYSEQKWGFILIGGEYALQVTLRGYRADIEYLNLRSPKEYGEPIFLTWYLLLMSRENFLRESNYELLQKSQESRIIIIKNMWNRILCGLEMHCHELLSGKAEEVFDFKVDHAFALERLKEALI